MMAQLDSARDELLDGDGDVLPGLSKDAKEAEKRIRHRLLPVTHGPWCQASSCSSPAHKMNCTNG